jgi:Immunoglobulin domain
MPLFDASMFLVLPQIVPFNIGEDEVNFDDSVMAACSINKGDLPLKLWWRFTESEESPSYNLTTNDGVVITRPSQKVTMLTIDVVKARHRGNYTCFAQNKAGATHFSAYLKVNGSKILKNIFFKEFCILILSVQLLTARSNYLMHLCF